MAKYKMTKDISEAIRKLPADTQIEIHEWSFDVMTNSKDMKFYGFTKDEYNNGTISRDDVKAAIYTMFFKPKKPLSDPRESPF